MIESVLARFATEDPSVETILEIADHYEANHTLVEAFGYYLIAISLQENIDPNLASKLGALAYKLGDPDFSLKCFRLAIDGQSDPGERDKVARAVTNLFAALGFKIQAAEPAPFDLGLPPLLEAVPGTRKTGKNACLVIAGDLSIEENGLLSMADGQAYRGILFRFGAMAGVAPKFNADLFLLSLARDLQPELILFRHAQLTSRASDPRVETLIAVGDQTATPVIGLYYDIAKPSFQRICRAYMAGLDGLITWDRPLPPSLASKGGIVISDLWTPLPGKLFHAGEMPPAVDIGFVGRAEAHFVIRRHYLDGLQAAGIEVVSRGLSFGGVLPIEAMAEFLRSCKIVLNFSTSAVISPWEAPGENAEVDHVKGRVFEAIACGALLFESQNDFTSRLFEPGTHYVEFANLEDLKEKLTYYLAHDEERESIARAATAYYQANYTGAHYWRRVDEMVSEIRAARQP
jgi:glycosyltransferase involved in cell wall biosynthesis